MSSTVTSIPEEVIVDSDDVNDNEGDLEEYCDDNEGQNEDSFDNQTNVSKRN